MTATCLPMIVWSTVLLWDIDANQMAVKYQHIEQGKLVVHRRACETSLQQLSAH